MTVSHFFRRRASLQAFPRRAWEREHSRFVGAGRLVHSRFVLVPTLCVGMPASTLRVEFYNFSRNPEDRVIFCETASINTCSFPHTLTDFLARVIPV